MKIGKILNNLATAILVGCAITVTVLILRREFFLDETNLSVRWVEKWKEISQQGGRVVGSKDARVQIIAFMDFECPPCRNLKPTLDALLEKYKRDLAVVMYNLPSKTHPNAYDAAIAAECAGMQDRYTVYQDILFRNQSLLGKKQWVVFARLADVPDFEGFERCVQFRATAAIVDRDIELARNIGIDATPTLIVNGRMVSGDPGFGPLDRLIQEALSRDSQ